VTDFISPAASTNFRASVKKISPPWLQGPEGYRLLYSIAFQLDFIAEYLRLGVLERMPGQCTEQALPAIGADRKMLRGFREGNAGYASRLSTAFETWRLAGNARTLLTELAAYFAPSPPKIRIVTPGRQQDSTEFTDWWTLDNGVFSYHRQTPANWDWDSTDGISHRGRFWIIVYNNEGFTPWYWGDGHFWGGGQSWGYEEEFTENFAADARRFIFQWKAAGSQAWRSGGIIVTDDQALWDPSGSDPAIYPNGTWQQPSNRYVGPFYLDGVLNQ
jgi:hypothetical protein